MRPERFRQVEIGQSRELAAVSPAVININRVASLIWKGPEYPLLSAGRYTVRAISYQGPQWVRSFKRWSVRIEFALTTEPGFVSAFFNMGDDRSGPRVGRQSRYYKAWVLANGGHPRKGQEMTPEVFLEGQFFEVEVEMCSQGADGAPKACAEAYSRITKIISAFVP